MTNAQRNFTHENLLQLVRLARIERARRVYLNQFPWEAFA